MINDKSEKIEQDISFWLDKEKRLKELFRGDIVNEKHFLNEKLRYFNSVKNKYQGNLSEGEKIVLNVLKGDIKKLENQLYPNLIVRFLVKAERAIKNYMEERKTLREQNRMKQPPLTFTAKNIHNSHRLSDNANKQNLKASATQEIQKNQQQDQKVNEGPLKNSVPERNAISTDAPRNTIGQKNNKDESLPKKQLRHRLH